MVDAILKACKTLERHNAGNCSLTLTAESRQELIDALEELKWWREQDVIQRSDVIGGCYCMEDLGLDCTRGVLCEDCTFNSINSPTIKEIPKAEKRE